MFIRRSALTIRTRVGLAIHVDQLRRIDVRIPLGGADARVAEQLLDGAQVGAALQEMRRERMTQRMRADAALSGELRHVFAQQTIDTAPREPRAAEIDEQ